MKELRLRFLPQVADDVRSGTIWYEEKAPGLGHEFRRAFVARATEVGRHPLIYREVYRDFRRCLIRRFPYGMYFRVDGDLVIVFGLFHSARDPETVNASLEKRGDRD